ncbi:MAG: NAD(P)H-hydrate dehydratase [Candidatus Sericytochromatia bacterium]|nr:NAD(P)H-hydrate dehydratase [Candidatus Tanganyikabacteria bacterium]
MIATVRETRELETELISGWGVPVHLLMERAALGVAAVTAHVATIDEPIAVLAGPGHNGGDAVAAARLLKGWGYWPHLFVDAKNLSAVTDEQLSWAIRCGIQARPLSDFAAAPVVVDGLFGFGLNRAPSGTLAKTIRRVNEGAARAVIAVDLPSGTEADTGVALGDRIRATHTVATGLIKVGVACDPAVDAVGELWQADIGVPVALAEKLDGAIIEYEALPERPAGGHKGTYGTLVVIGGSRAMVGAPGLAALAAGRAGTGLVVVAVPRQHAGAIAALMPEALVVPLEAYDDGSLDDGDWSDIAPWLERADAVAIGPGLGRDEGQIRLVRRVWDAWDGPLVCDADSLVPDLKDQPPAGPAVFTPHPGEAARLLGTSPEAVQADRLDAARRIAADFGVICVLKGARTIAARPDGRFGVLLRTTPALATAGSGDVLTGIIGGFLAQGRDPWLATSQGIARHAELGRAAAGESPDSGLLARDLLNYRGVLRKSLPDPDKTGSLAIRLS